MGPSEHLPILLDENLNLRSGWRFALYVAVLVAALSATGLVISLAIEPGTPLSPLFLLAVNAASRAAAAVIALAFMKRFVDQVPLLAFGVGFHEQWARDLAAGLGISLAMVGLYLAGTSVAGNTSVTAAPEPEGYLGNLFFLLGVLAIAAATEELVFRGYALQVLMYGAGAWPAFLVMSTLFGLGHSFNPNATWVSTTNSALAGILLCLAYTRTRSLWLPFGIHIGWNLGIGPILGFPLSGTTIRSFWVTETGGPTWLTGGAYGPEGGLLVTGIMISAAVVIGTTLRFDVSPSVNRVLTRHPMKVAPVGLPTFPVGTGGT